ncbi:Non-histone chromosomal protein 6 [Mortierella alpina]|nr:Non-histone chromosomal protein 6 [Mortierella alpina]
MSALSTIVNLSTSSPKGKQTVATALLSNGSNPPAQGNHPTSTADISKSSASASSAEDIKYRRKYKDLKKRIRDIEDDNDVLNIKLSRARKNIHRLRVERRLDQSEHGANPSSSSSSSSDSDTDGERNGGESSSRSHRRHNRHSLDRYKHHRHPYSHHTSQSLHGPHGSSNSLAPPSNSANAHGRSKTPPSRGSSIARSAQHSASSSIGGPMSVQIMEPPQASAHLPTTGGKRTIKKRRKDPLAPKRPSNAFFIFSQQHRQQAREEKKEGNQSELTKFLGLQWKSMPPTEKKIYSELAIQDRNRYLVEMIQYQHEQRVQGANGMEEITTIKRKPGKPGRPPKSAKISIDAAAATSGISHTTVVSNGHGTARSVGGGGKMEIRSMVNANMEGDEMMSHDDDEDVRMEAGSEDEHEEVDEDEDGDEGGDDDDDDDDVVVEDEGEEGESEEVEMHVTHGQHHNYTADVEMAHKAQEIGTSNGLVVSA